VKSLREINDPQVIHEALSTEKPIAIIGLSPKSHRDSYRIGEYLLKHGYDVLGVHPSGQEVLGCEVTTDLSALTGRGIEVVDVFLNPDRLLPIVEQAIGIGAKYLWFQFGVVNEEAAELAQKAGIEVIMDRCIKVEHSSDQL